MIERIRDDYAARVNFEGTDDGVLVSPKYDRVDVFGWIGWSILRVIDNEGMAHLHMTEEVGRRVATTTGLPLAECEVMMRSDYETYLTVQERSLSDDWLSD
jgi:hypothetical protein